MPAPLPFLKINDKLRINLFNVLHVQQDLTGSTYIHFVGEAVMLAGDEAQRFLDYIDACGDKLVAAQPQPAPAAESGPRELQTERNFSELVHAREHPLPSEDV